MRPVSVTVLTVLCAVSSTQMARANLPADQVIQFAIHNVPDNPATAVVFRVTLTMHASNANGNAIGWTISRIRFREPGLNGAPDSVWTKNWPVVNSPDGRWWVQHADPEHPQRAEFAKPPLLVGTALADAPSNSNLSYDFEGLAYTPPAGGAPYDVTAALNYYFARIGAQTPITEGEDEPVEIPPDAPEPPSGD